MNRSAASDLYGSRHGSLHGQVPAAEVVRLWRIRTLNRSEDDLGKSAAI